MEQEKITVIFKARAAFNIAAAAWYIAEKGYPETAENYRNRLFEFGKSLAHFPDKYPVSNHPVYKRKLLRCAVFEHTYLFVYKIVKNKLTIYTVIHCKRLK